MVSSISRPPRRARRVAGEAEVVDDERRRHRLRRAAQQRAQAGDQLRQGTGFDQVVIGTEIQPATRFLDAVPRGGHDDAHGGAVTGAKPPAELEAIDVGEAEVEHDRVVRAHARPRECPRGVGGHIHRASGVAEVGGCNVGHSRIVFDEQDPHEWNLRRTA